MENTIIRRILKKILIKSNIVENYKSKIRGKKISKKRKYSTIFKQSSIKTYIFKWKIFIWKLKS